MDKTVGGNRNWFTSRKMTWTKVILLAIITAVVTAVLNLIPVLHDTSFQDIAVNFDCWILFAVFIIVNCEKWYEAVLKTFVFFLISQPLIYLIQVPFSGMGFGIFQYYIYWLKITFLTLPGAFIAFQLKRKNWLSVAVLSVANAFLGYMAVRYFWTVRSDFPKHILSMCFCIGLAIFMSMVLLDRKAHRLVAVAVVVISIAASLIITKPNNEEIIQLDEGNWTCSVEDPTVVSVVMEDADTAVVTAVKDGSTLAVFTDANGNIREYYISVGAGSIYINEFD